MRNVHKIHNYSFRGNSMRKEILELKTYYQEFHHKCISWYITVMGFFIAGSIATSTLENTSNKSIGWTIIVFTLLISLLFFLCIFHYSKRIEVLGKYLLTSKKIPENWYRLSTKVGIAIHGIGSWFFFSIIVLLQGAVIWLITTKYLY